MCVGGALTVLPPVSWPDAQLEVRLGTTHQTDALFLYSKGALTKRGLDKPVKHSSGSSCCSSGAPIWHHLFFCFLNLHTWLQAPDLDLHPLLPTNCFCPHFWMIYKSNCAEGRMVGFLAQQLWVVGVGAGHVFAGVVRHTRMCVVRGAASCLRAKQVYPVNWNTLTAPPAAVRFVEFEEGWKQEVRMLWEMAVCFPTSAAVATWGSVNRPMNVY